MEAKHTATPWEVCGETQVWAKGKAQHVTSLISTTEENNSANAEFIARACNAHDDLVETLKMTLAAAEENAGQLCHDDLQVIRESLAKAGA